MEQASGVYLRPGPLNKPHMDGDRAVFCSEARSLFLPPSEARSYCDTELLLKGLGVFLGGKLTTLWAACKIDPDKYSGSDSYQERRWLVVHHRSQKLDI